MSDYPPLRLNANGLLSKWGFDDGDVLSHYRDMLEDDHGMSMDSAISSALDYSNRGNDGRVGLDLEWEDHCAECRALRRLVWEYVVPAVRKAGHAVDVRSGYSLIHNNMRAHTLDGEIVSHQDTSDNRLEEIEVEIPFEDVERIVLESAKEIGFE